MGAGVATSPHCPSSMQRLPARRPAGRVVRTGPKPCSPRFFEAGFRPKPTLRFRVPSGPKPRRFPLGPERRPESRAHPFPSPDRHGWAMLFPKARRFERSRSFPLATGPVDRKPKPPLSGLGCFRKQAPWTSLRLRTGEPAGSVRRISGSRSLLPFAFRGPLRSRGSSSFLTIPRPPKLLRSRSAARAGTLRPRPSGLPLPSGQAPGVRGRYVEAEAPPSLGLPSDLHRLGSRFGVLPGSKLPSGNRASHVSGGDSPSSCLASAVPRPKAPACQDLFRCRTRIGLSASARSAPFRAPSPSCLRSVSVASSVRLQLEGVTDRESHQADSACG
jgi:hypothetical protein